MNDREFPEYKKQSHRKNTWSRKAPVHGFDTETYLGKATLITSEYNYIEPQSIEDVLTFLSRKSFRSCYNFFYNIKFDFGSMMKWLPYEDFKELITTDNLEYDKWKIFYLPQKMLSVKSNKHKNEYYNLTNFYKGSLKANMKERLEIQKFGNVDANLINSSYGYYDRNREEIIKYCLRDSLGAKQLGELLQDNYFKTIGIHPKKYISTANITGNYYQSNTYIPTLTKLMNEQPEVIEYYWAAYMGARFEVLRKGYFEGPVYDYDLKSAYPGTISKLININMGEWRKVDQVNKDSFYGVYKVKVGCGSGHLMPFGYRTGNSMSYPQEYDNKINFLTKGEIFSYEHDAKIEIVDGWEYYPERIIRPFDKIVEHVFKRKEEIKKEFGKDSSEYDVIKKSLNTYYGLTVNINDGVSGRHFNPIYGAETTSDCRREVYKQAKAAGASTIAIETDGVWTDKKIPGLRLNNELGTWAVDEHKWLFLTGSGQLCSDGVLRTRGTPRRKVGNLLEIAQQNPTLKSIRFNRKRPVGMIEALRLNKYDIKDINVWNNFYTSMGCNGDKGRDWREWEYTFKDLLGGNFSSEPWGGQ